MDNSKEQPMEKCKHQTGIFQEVIEAMHERRMEKGELDKDSFNNDYGNLIGHSYRCSSCSKVWRWKYKPQGKWLIELFEKAYSYGH